MKSAKYIILLILIILSSGCISSKYALVQNNINNGEWDQAEKICNEILQKDSTAGTAYHYLGLIFSHRGNDNSALEMFKKSMKYQPTFESSVEIAQIYFNHNRLFSAKAYLDSAKMLNPTSEEIKAFNIKVQALLSSSEKAFKVGKDFYRENNFYRAEQKFQQALNINIENDEAKYYLNMAQGLVLYHLRSEDNYWDAIMKFAEAANAQSHRGEPHYLMALCYYQKDSNDFENTIRELNRALELELAPYYREKAQRKLAEVIKRKKKLDAFWGKD